MDQLEQYRFILSLIDRNDPEQLTALNQLATRKPYSIIKCHNCFEVMDEAQLIKQQALECMESAKKTAQDEAQKTIAEALSQDVDYQLLQLSKHVERSSFNHGFPPFEVE